MKEEINEMEECICAAVQCINSEVVEDVVYIPANNRNGIDIEESLIFTIRAGGDCIYVVRAYGELANTHAKTLHKGITIKALDAVPHKLSHGPLKMCLIANEIVV